MDANELAEMIERPSTTDISIDLVRQRIPLAVLEEDITSLRKLPHLVEEGGPLDIGTRRDAIILSGNGREIVIHDNGLVRTRFRSLPLAMVHDVIHSLFTHLAAVCNWDMDAEFLSFHSDLIYYWNVDKPPIDYVMEFVDVEKLRASGILDDNQVIPGAGIQLFLTSLDDTPDDTPETDIRMEIAPARREPHRKFYVNVTGLSLKTTLGAFRDHLRELTDVSSKTLKALSRES